MTINDILGWLVVIFGLTTCAAEVWLAVKCPEQRWLRIFKAITTLWISMVFLLNVVDVLVSGGAYVPPAVGRPALTALLGVMLAGAIYTHRTRRC